MTAQWGTHVPAAVNGTDEQKRRAFLDAYAVLRSKIEVLASLPMDNLDRLALQERVSAIGAQ
jgi:arsenate reductase